MKSRLFISLDIPAEIKNKIHDVIKEIAGPNHLKWEGLQKYHFTLKFLGDVENDRIELIANSIVKAAGESRSFKVDFTRFGIFYRRKEPKILWLGVEVKNEMAELQNMIEEEMNSLGFEKEKRKFKPHLTLLRIKSKKEIEKVLNFQNYEVDNLNYIANQISLMKSELLPSGSVYKTIQSFKLTD